MSKESDKAAAVSAARERLEQQAAIDLLDLSLLTGVHVSTIQRAAARDELFVPVARIGQRYVIPAEPVRKFLATGELVA